MTEPSAPVPVDIKDLRRRIGLPGQPISQGELALRLGGISQSTVSRMEEEPARQRGPVLVLLRALDAEYPRSGRKARAA